ncbi:hypothetical protein, partial [Stenotrophomonas panacihumi]
MKPPHTALSAGIALALAQAAALPFSVLQAQTQVGPGSVTTTVTATSGDTVVVGNTNISTTGTTDGVRANGGNVTLDMQAGPSPGAIIDQTTNGAALHATLGGISVPNGINLRTTGGRALWADGGTISLVAGNVAITGVGLLAGASSGSIDISNTSYNDPVLTSGTQGSGIGVDGTGLVTLGGGNRLYIGRAGAAANPVGLGVQGTGARIVVNNALPITFQGNGALGMYLYGGGHIDTNAAISLVFTGTSSVGITVDGAPTDSVLRNVTATFNNTSTSTSSGTGLVAQNGGQVTVQDFVVQGAGVGLGIWVQPNSTVNVTGASRIGVTSTRNGQRYGFSPGSSSMSSGPIFSTAGAPSWRAAGLVLGGTLNSQGTTWTNTTAGGYGLFVGQNGTTSVANLNGDNVSTTGAQSDTVATYARAIVNATGSTFRNEGGYDAFYMWNYGSPTQATGDNEVHLVDSTVTTTGSADGVYAVNQAPGYQNIFTMQGGSMQAGGAAFYVYGPLSATLTDTTVGGTQALLFGGAMDSTGDPTLAELVATRSTLTGMAGGATSATTDITLLDHSHWTGQAWNLSNATIDATSVWTIPEISNVSGLVSNQGRIEFTEPVNDVYKHLYTQSYVGTAGSVIAMNTWLAEDDSPTDQLILDGGTATGQSALEIHNSGGGGALTLGDGIRVVATLNGATTAPGAFT